MKSLQKWIHSYNPRWWRVAAYVDGNFTQVIEPEWFIRNMKCPKVSKRSVSSFQKTSLFQCTENILSPCQTWSRQQWQKHRLSVNNNYHWRPSSRHLSQQTTEEMSCGNVRDSDVSSSNTTAREHIPVMVEEVLKSLVPQEGQVIVDMTFGAGGHAKEILSRTAGIKYIASDRDPYAHGLAKKMSSQNSLNGGELVPILSRFSELPHHLNKLGISPGSVDGFLFDLGASSMQFDQAARGFALSKDGPLDMRMDSQRFPESFTAADAVNTLSSQDLAHIIKKYGEEPRCHHIANAIVEARYALGNFTRTQQLAEVVMSVFDSLSFRQDKLFRHSHLATKTFQALRIFVNNELNEIHNGMEIARHFLKQDGRCVVISFHSLEDRIVKRHFHGVDVDEMSNTTLHHHFRNSIVCHDLNLIKEDYMSRVWRPVSRKVYGPSEEECLRNPRARSAKLRAAIRDDHIFSEDKV